MDPRSRLPDGARVALDQTPVRCDIFLGGGNIKTMFHGIRRFEHGELCRAFGLDPVRFYFDLPSSCRGTGSLSSGNRGTRRITGFVFMHGQTEPYAKLTELRQGDKIQDDDPANRSEWEKFKQ